MPARSVSFAASPLTTRLINCGSGGNVLVPRHLLDLEELRRRERAGGHRPELGGIEELERFDIRVLEDLDRRDLAGLGGIRDGDRATSGAWASSAASFALAVSGVAGLALAAGG